MLPVLADLKSVTLRGVERHYGLGKSEFIPGCQLFTNREYHNYTGKKRPLFSIQEPQACHYNALKIAFQMKGIDYQDWYTSVGQRLDEEESDLGATDGRGMTIRDKKDMFIDMNTKRLYAPFPKKRQDVLTGISRNPAVAIEWLGNYINKKELSPSLLKDLIDEYDVITFQGRNIALPGSLFTDSFHVITPFDYAERDGRIKIFSIDGDNTIQGNRIMDAIIRYAKKVKKEPSDLTHEEILEATGDSSALVREDDARELLEGICGPVLTPIGK